MSATTETVVATTNPNTSSPLLLKLETPTQSNGRVVPIKHSAPSKVVFGAEVYGIDLNNFTDADFEFISDALHKHKLLNARQVHGIPGAENVRLIGKGPQGADHYGLKDLNIRGVAHDFHAKDLPSDEFELGFTRFHRRKLGAEKSMIAQLYDLLSPEEKQMADYSWVEYWPHPYMRIENCKGNANGLGLVNQGKELTIEEIGDYDQSKYPLCWVNLVTGEKAFQVHGIYARKLYLRSGPDEIPKVVEDVTEIRKLLSDIQMRILKPQYIFLPPVDEGDVLMWDNYGLFHSAVDYPLEKYGPQTMH
ncbi:hypothetical protein AC578_3183 [Pseudocercospora eumusae]|uniref:TauD/TfdA-like domain-containing protein n=1 Tax=Pseudocercospora eumusae TaxID=321146 RepID=A0A139GU41_9PEZI|nr:hypothetical protein AC578_3183 [Pseudocercospora eumusae]